MRTPQDLPPREPRPRRRHRAVWWVIGVVIVLIAIVASLKSLATLYTDSLWFSSVHLHSVWSTLLAVKVGLFASFGAIFFVALWVNLTICDRLGAGEPELAAEDELVRRYQHVVRPYAGRVHGALALVVALIAASSTVGEWNNWLLFVHGVSFGVKDPQFGKDVGFFVFKLPFLSFVVNWTLIALVVMFVVTVVFHYLNGGIRLQRAAPRVRPAVKVHLSVLLALVAAVKALGYLLQRYQLDVSNNGYVNGAGYTDVHARLPALELLFWISLFAAIILLVNIRQRGWTLPVLAVGMWALVALVIGVIYPAVLQTFKVNPAQSSLERPYIARNIKATRAAYDLNNVTTSSFANNTTTTASSVQSSMPTLNDVRLWDPDPQISLQTFQRQQGTESYYVFQSVGVDRYTVDGPSRDGATPVIEGVRQIDGSNLPSSGWVNEHLAYTHGLGMALAPANQQSAGYPRYAVRGVPPSSSAGLPQVTQPDVYFGLDDPGYVVANTKEPEVDYQLSNGTTKTSHYQGHGGVQLNSFLKRAAFAVRFGDFNLLVSNQITSRSRMLFVRDVLSMAQKAAPFLSFDHDPYAVIVNGHIDWVLDAYTTTDMYPYSQNASSAAVPPGSGLPSSYNYVRNSVKVVVDAYTGKMTFYAMDNDPILRTYELAFPHMFVPASKMSPTLRAHLRYPEDYFAIQTAMYGRYHITNPAAFYSPTNNAWNLSPTVGAGPPGQALAVTVQENSQGQLVTGPLQRMAPIYQQMQLPGERQTSFTITEAYAPYSGSNALGNYTLPAFAVGTIGGPGDTEKLHVYKSTSSSQPPLGPVQADSEIQQQGSVSRQISLLDQHGSQVLLGNTLMVPVGQSMLYVRPLYVTSASYPIPQLQDVIAVFGQKVAMDSTLDGALTDVLGIQVGSGSTGQANHSPASSNSSSAPPGSISASTAEQAQQDLKAAAQDYSAAQNALKGGAPNSLAIYESDINAMNSAIQQAQQLLNSSTTPTTVPSHSSTGASVSPSTSASSTTTTTTPPRSSPASPSSPTSPTPTTGGQSNTTARPPRSGATTTTTKPNET